ncbi:MAG: hypothetical protein O9311_08045 [Cytophagales bacterium]|nr:hypothetical protein [Cytophagales bacterium]
MKNLVTIFFFLAFAGNVYAQDIRTAHLKWTVAGMHDVDNNTFVPSYTCTFETNGTGATYWKQKNGSYSTKYTVQNITGTWADVATDGIATFNVIADGESGTLKFEKNSNGTRITLDLSQPDGSRNVYTFTVTQTTLL